MLSPHLCGLVPVFFGGSAADWVSVKTEHLVVFAHDPEPATTVSVSAEEIFQRVLDYWLPTATELDVKARSFP